MNVNYLLLFLALGVALTIKEPAAQDTFLVDFGSEHSSGSSCGSYSVPENPITRKDYPDQPIVFDHEIHIWGQDYSRSLIYLPAHDREIAPGRFPLAILLHGRGFDYSEYTSIQRQLAHNGIASISIQYSQTHHESDYDEAAVYEVVDKTLHNIYANLEDTPNPLYGRVTRFISFIGHSMGGGFAVYSANRVTEEQKHGVKVRSVMALAPNPQADKEWHLTPDAAQGLLVLFGSDDADTGVNSIWNSGFYLYDKSGYLRNEYTNNYSKNAFTKSLVYLRNVNHTSYLDGAESVALDTVIGYLTAYARWSLLGDPSYRVYFRQQEPLTAKIKTSLLHSEPYRRVLDNFEDSSVGFNTLGGKNTFKNIEAKNDYSVFFPGDSAHHTEALLIKWDHSNDSPELPRTVFRLPMPLKGHTDDRDLSGFKYLSFRVGQIDDPKTNNPDLDFVIRLSYLYNKTLHSQTRPLSDFGSVPFPLADGQAAETKSTMNTVIVPLCAFDQIVFDEALITAIEFEFTSKGSQSGHIQIDSLELF